MMITAEREQVGFWEERENYLLATSLLYIALLKY